MVLISSFEVRRCPRMIHGCPYPGNDMSHRNGIYISGLVLMLLVPLVTTATPIIIDTGPARLAEGDDIVIRGSAYPGTGIGILGLGRGYINYTRVVSDREGSFSYIISGNETSEFMSGPYAYIFVLDDADCTRTIRLDTSQETIHVTSGDQVIYTFSRNLTSSMVSSTANSLRDAINKSNGQSTMHTIFVELAYVRFDDIGTNGILEQHEEKKISLSGTTNIASGTIFSVRVFNAIDNTTVLAGTVLVTKGKETNQWFFTSDLTHVASGEYGATVGWNKSAITGSATTLFTLRNSNDQSDRSPPTLLTISSLALVGLIGIVTIRNKRIRRK